MKTASNHSAHVSGKFRGNRNNHVETHTSCSIAARFSMMAHSDEKLEREQP